MYVQKFIYVEETVNIYKRSMSLIALLAILLMMTLLSGCFGGSKTGTESNAETSGPKPAWLTITPPADDSNFYFVGSVETKSFDGVRDAYQRAVARMSQTLSQQAGVAYEETIKSDISATDKSELIRNIANNMIRGAKELENYWEKIEVTTAQGVEYHYRAYALVALPKKTLNDKIVEAQNAKDQEKQKALENVRDRLGKFLETAPAQDPEL